MTKKSLEWNDVRRVVTEVAAGPWRDWLLTARKPKDLVLNEAELKLASRLGLPMIPKGTGMLSFGWVVKKLMERAGQQMPDNDPVFLALSNFTNGTQRQVPGMARLVLDLMVHRELVTKHSHNAFHHYGTEDDNVRLFEDHWNALNEDVLRWAMMQSPLGELSTAGKDEWITEVHTRENRLHNVDGPAFLTSKGRTLYALNGVTMTKEEFALRGRPLMILDIQNAEVRRVLIEDMGADNFITTSGLKPIHTDETGSLYRLEDARKEAWARRHLCWVHVRCPSTDREYMLAVPPHTRTAREGVAWTFRKLPEEYNPGQET